MTITKDMLISDIIRNKPEAVQILMSYGMACIGCPASQMESLEQAAGVHGVNVDELVNALNQKEA